MPNWNLYKNPEEVKNKIREGMKKAWKEGRSGSPFTKGHKINLGRKWNKERDRKRVETRKRNKFTLSKESRINISKSLKEYFKKHGYPESAKIKSREQAVKTNAIKRCHDALKNDPQKELDRRRKISETLTGRPNPWARGKLHPNWKGGKSYEKYPREFYIIRKTILKRDGMICRKCFKFQGKFKLHVHHIDGDKTNNNTSNLISLCYICHAKLERSIRS